MSNKIDMDIALINAIGHLETSVKLIHKYEHSAENETIEQNDYIVSIVDTAIIEALATLKVAKENLDFANKDS